MGIVEQYLLQLNSEKRRWRRAAAILVVLSLFVASGVSWNLRMTGITIANGAACGQEEHQHTAECPVEKVLICGYTEEPQVQEPPPPPAVPVTEPAAMDPAESTLPSVPETLPEPTEEQKPPEQPRHEHTDGCYEITWQCGMGEHIHALSCYADATADIESAAIWEAGLPEQRVLCLRWRTRKKTAAASIVCRAERQRRSSRQRQFPGTAIRSSPTRSHR